MAFQPVPFTCSAVIHNKLPGNQDFLVDLSFVRGGDEPTQLEMAVLASVIDGWWGNDIMPLLCDTVNYVEVIVTQLALEFGFQVFSAASAGPGSITSEQAPNAQAACISLRTGIRGRSFRGRNYISGVPNTEIDVNELSSGFMTSVRAAYENLLPGGSSDPTPFRWVIVSRRFNNAQREVGITTPVENSLFTDNIIDDQRRRKPGVGA